MKIRMGILFLCFILPVNVFGQGKSLKKLESLTVAIEYLPANLDHSGLSRVQLKKYIEKKLSQNGIKVDSVATFTYLYLSINALSMNYKKKGMDKNKGVARYVYNVELNLMQPVSLLRNSSIFDFNAITWSKNATGYTTPVQLQTDIKNVIGELVNRFITAYTEANGGKKMPKTTKNTPQTIK